MRKRPTSIMLSEAHVALGCSTKGCESNAGRSLFLPRSVTPALVESGTATHVSHASTAHTAAISVITSANVLPRDFTAPPPRCRVLCLAKRSRILLTPTPMSRLPRDLLKRRGDSAASGSRRALRRAPDEGRRHAPRQQSLAEGHHCLQGPPARDRQRRQADLGCPRCPRGSTQRALETSADTLTQRRQCIIRGSRPIRLVIHPGIDACCRLGAVSPSRPTCILCQECAVFFNETRITDREDDACTRSRSPFSSAWRIRT